MATSKYTESAGGKKHKAVEVNKIAQGDISKTVAPLAARVSAIPKKGETPVASLFDATSGLGSKVVSKASTMNITTPRTSNLLVNDSTPSPTTATGQTFTGKHKISTMPPSSKITASPSNFDPISGDTRKTPVPASKVIGTGGSASPTASTPRTSVLEPKRKSAKIDAKASIGHQSFGRRALEFFSWGSKPSKSRFFHLLLFFSSLMLLEGLISFSSDVHSPYATRKLHPMSTTSEELSTELTTQVVTPETRHVPRVIIPSDPGAAVTKSSKTKSVPSSSSTRKMTAITVERTSSSKGKDETLKQKERTIQDRVTAKTNKPFDGKTSLLKLNDGGI